MKLLDKETGKKLIAENNPWIHFSPGYKTIEGLQISYSTKNNITETILTGHIGDYYFEKVKNSELVAK